MKLNDLFETILCENEKEIREVDISDIVLKNGMFLLESCIGLT